jgi:deoxyribose-phosphate aldolase
MTEIQPYGDEWVQEMMKFKKIDIIKILRGAIFGKMQEVDAAMKVGKLLKQQRDEAYQEIRRLKELCAELIGPDVKREAL